MVTLALKELDVGAVNLRPFFSLVPSETVGVVWGVVIMLVPTHQHGGFKWLSLHPALPCIQTQGEGETSMH
jgi:hypothetical protein